LNFKNTVSRFRTGGIPKGTVVAAIYRCSFAYSRPSDAELKKNAEFKDFSGTRKAGYSIPDFGLN